MYITYKNKNYPCKCTPSAMMVYSGLPEDFPAPVDAVIQLCNNDGFVMREDDPADYLRQTFSNGVLTLTNEPEPEPVEPTEPEPTTEERVTVLEDSYATMEDAMCEMDAITDERIAALEDALCELDML